ncbi:hypothetical protein RCO48_24945 [Peribacillus frigoritolerans]|nr:hypothetical protein [Peribacillus frigoritolerans]
MDDIVELVSGRSLGNPAITLVGDIISLRGKLQWFEKEAALWTTVFSGPDGDGKKVPWLKPCMNLAAKSSSFLKMECGKSENRRKSAARFSFV